MTLIPHLPKIIWKLKFFSLSSWKRPPHLPVMRNALVAAGDKVGDNGRPVGEEVEHKQQKNRDRPSAPNVTISEFASLIDLMRDDKRYEAHYSSLDNII